VTPAIACYRPCYRLLSVCYRPCHHPCYRGALACSRAALSPPIPPSAIEARASGLWRPGLASRAGKGRGSEGSQFRLNTANRQELDFGCGVTFRNARHRQQLTRLVTCYYCPLAADPANTVPTRWKAMGTNAGFAALSCVRPHDGKSREGALWAQPIYLSVRVAREGEPFGRRTAGEVALWPLLCDFNGLDQKDPHPMPAGGKPSPARYLISSLCFAAVFQKPLRTATRPAAYFLGRRLGWKTFGPFWNGLPVFAADSPMRNFGLALARRAAERKNSPASPVWP
jgi:hypothetical protein